MLFISALASPLLLFAWIPSHREEGKLGITDPRGRCEFEDQLKIWVLGGYGVISGALSLACYLVRCILKFKDLVDGKVGRW